MNVARCGSTKTAGPNIGAFLGRPRKPSTMQGDFRSALLGMELSKEFQEPSWGEVDC